MLYLLLAILASASLNIFFKITESRNNGDRYGLSLVNQATAFLLSLFFARGLPLFSTGWFTSMAQEWSGVFSAAGGEFGESASLGFAVLVALLAGAMSYICVVVLQASTAKNGSALTVAFNKVGVLIPALLSLLFFGEVPSVWQAVGVAVSVCAILMVYLQKGEGTAGAVKLLLIGTMCAGGFMDFISKIYEVYGSASGEKTFLLYQYLIATVIALAVFLKNRSRVGKTELIFGAVTGVIYQLISKFLLRSLSYLSAFVVFPLFSVGVILTVNIVNLLVFREKLTRRQYGAIGLMLLACVLLNL